ncbi:hypothetical protein CWI38_0459p0020 [Hamiltosporidium tvaerminnensis]|uniref:Uncharacterized protein n=1 Tax=Hamiltosporidium tvaerminnensis TaxID=1176355 RepID=A0A4V2JXW2_9MICR|nr:hypothetical protein CWI38_0459p0020 [Hamiltosporidium tvaerminnensis]
MDELECHINSLHKESLIPPNEIKEILNLAVMKGLLTQQDITVIPTSPMSSSSLIHYIQLARRNFLYSNNDTLKEFSILQDLRNTTRKIIERNEMSEFTQMAADKTNELKEIVNGYIQYERKFQKTTKVSKVHLAWKIEEPVNVEMFLFGKLSSCERKIETGNTRTCPATEYVRELE